MQISKPSDASEDVKIDFKRVRRLFGWPGKLAESDFLRREIADRMRERLSLVKIAPKRVLDAGCGEGSDLAELQNLYPAAQVIGADISSAMLEKAAARYSTQPQRKGGLFGKWLADKTVPEVGLICSDFARLPFTSGMADVLWSNLSLHWHPRPDKVFSEWLRVLRTDGLLMFSCFGPDTLQELRAAFALADRNPHVLPFVEMHDLGDMLAAAGFSSPVLDREVITVTYGSVEKLFADVRAFGGNALTGRRRGLLGKNAWKKVCRHLEQNKNAEGRISLSFEIVYGHAFCPAPARTAEGEAIVRFMPRT